MDETQAWNPATQGRDVSIKAVMISLHKASIYELQFEERELVIGRSSDCHIREECKQVSSLHLRIWRDEAFRFYIEELGKCGCWLNDQLMRVGDSRALNSGDVLTIGKQPYEKSKETPFAAYIFRVKGINSDEAKDMPDPTSPPAQAAESSNVAVPDDVDPARKRTEAWVKENWDLNHVLGSGNFSEVRLGLAVKTGDRRAVKMINKAKFQGFRKKRSSNQNLTDEAELLLSLVHPHIITFYDYFVTDAHLYIIMEMMRGGDLLQCIMEDGYFQEHLARRLFHKVCDAVRYLHERSIVHRDLKPENVLLTTKDRDKMEPKIADFGLARKNRISKDCRTFCGTPFYFAPEVITTFRDIEDGKIDAGYGKQADMWSLGVILYILLSGIPPFEDENLYEQITAAKYEFDAKEFLTVTPESKDLVSMLMVVDPKKRLTIQETLSHKWLIFSSPGSPPPPVNVMKHKELVEHDDRETKRRRTNDMDVVEVPTVAQKKEPEEGMVFTSEGVGCGSQPCREEELLRISPAQAGGA